MRSLVDRYWEVKFSCSGVERSLRNLDISSLSLFVIRGKSASKRDFFFPKARSRIALPVINRRRGRRIAFRHKNITQGLLTIWLVRHSHKEEKEMKNVEGRKEVPEKKTSSEKWSKNPTNSPKHNKRLQKQSWWDSQLKDVGKTKTSLGKAKKVKMKPSSKPKRKSSIGKIIQMQSKESSQEHFWKSSMAKTRDFKEKRKVW